MVQKLFHVIEDTILKGPNRYPGKQIRKQEVIKVVFLAEKKVIHIP